MVVWEGRVNIISVEDNMSAHTRVFLDRSKVTLSRIAQQQTRAHEA